MMATRKNIERARRGGMVETWERIKWAAITCGVKLKERTLDDALMSVVREKIEQEGRRV